ncbi:MAG: mechanosensitive ion channel domain-containing protein [Polyangiales bacterium]
MPRLFVQVIALGLGVLALASLPSLIGAQAAPDAGVVTAPALPLAAKPAEVKLHETLAFRLLVDRPQLPAAQRALSASRALEHAFEAGQLAVRIDTHADARVLFVGDVPIVELYETDARAAERISLDVYAANVAAQVRVALTAERRRSAIAASVFSISLVVFFGFVALYSLRKIGELAVRSRDAITQHPERIAPIRLHSVRVIGAGPLRAILLGAVIVGRWVLQFSVVYVWLVLSLSRFEITRPYTARLNRAVIDPLSALAQRSLGSLPVLVIGFVLVAAVFVAVRFVELFFMGVSRGRERVVWLPRDLVAPFSALLRIAIVMLAVIFAGPIVSDDPQGVPARLGSGVLFGLALAVTPLLCAIGWGAVLIFTRRIELGWQVELGGCRGRVVSVGLLDVGLRGADGSLYRVPHLRSLVTPLRVLSPEPRLGVELSVSPAVEPDAVMALFMSALRTADGSEDARVELLAVDANGARYRASVSPRDERTRSELLKQLVSALQRENIALGLGPAPERSHG